jgi:hypothetical protein
MDSTYSPGLNGRFPFDRIVCLLSLVLVLGCRPQPEESALGKWQTSDGKQRLEFHRDGSLNGVDEYGQSLSGSFSRIDPERIRLNVNIRTTNATGQITADSASGVCQLIANDDSLTLVEPDGKRTEYRKLK